MKPKKHIYQRLWAVRAKSEQSEPKKNPSKPLKFRGITGGAYEARTRDQTRNTLK